MRNESAAAKSSNSNYAGNLQNGDRGEGGVFRMFRWGWRDYSSVGYRLIDWCNLHVQYLVEWIRGRFVKLAVDWSLAMCIVSVCLSVPLSVALAYAMCNVQCLSCPKLTDCISLSHPGHPHKYFQIDNMNVQIQILYPIYRKWVELLFKAIW